MLAIADTDSYLKWSWATLQAMPQEWQRDQVVINNPVAPSPGQVRSATGGAVARLSLPRLMRRLSRDRPEVVLLACTGPVVQALLNYPALRGLHRPVLVGGLPGISIPATANAIKFRYGLDLFIVHSQRERRDFSELAGLLDPQLRITVATLPFLPAATSRPPNVGAGTTVVFAAQAKVPPEAEDRRAVLRALADLSAPLHAVIKLRASAGEEQTHHERWSYPRLWAELVAEGSVPADRVEFVTGSMAAALAGAAGFVTVSSTAVLEAFALGIPTVVLADFGVSGEMINLVFAESGVLGSLADVRSGRFGHPDPRWLADNYFHSAATDDWLPAIEELLSVRAATGLPERPFRSGHPLKLARRQLRLLLPATVWRLFSRVRRLPRRQGPRRPELRQPH